MPIALDEDFDEEYDDNFALQELLQDNIVFLNNHWWKIEWPDEAKDSFSVNVLCSDAFGYATADAEELPYSELESLYRHWLRDPTWGSVVWVIKQRKTMPLLHIVEKIVEKGIWDRETLLKSASGIDVS